jgi:hypothetical protein
MATAYPGDGVDRSNHEELAQVLSGLLGRIHQLRGEDLLTVMAIDDRMRRGALEHGDLKALKAVAKRNAK